MKYVISPEFNEWIINDRSAIPDGYVDLSRAADMVLSFRESGQQADPYVHSSFIGRMTAVSKWLSDIDDLTTDEIRLLTKNIALVIVLVMLERSTNLETMPTTPAEALEEIFSDEFIKELRLGLSAVPYHVSSEDLTVALVDLYGVRRLAMKMSPNMWMSPEDEERAEERRLFRPNEIRFEIIDASEVIGEEHTISEYDEWAEDEDFPWEPRPRIDDGDWYD